jgi:lipoprotein NlpI
VPIPNYANSSVPFRIIDQVIRLDPKYVEAFVNRGFVYATKGDYDRAILDFDKAIELKPNFAEAFLNRGIAKLRSGDPASGNADIAIAKQLDSTIGY